MTNVGRLFTWGSGWHGCLGYNNSCNELWLKRVKHGRFAGLFIVCASVGHNHSVAIDSSGLVPNLLLLHYPRYCYSVDYFLSLLALLSLFWTLQYGPIHSLRDLKRIGS